MEDELLHKLWSTFSSPDYKAPVLPRVAVKLTHMAQDPKTNFSQIAHLMEEDAFLAGEVLRTARSPVYAGRSEVVSIEQALSRLGLQTLRDIVLQVALTSRVFRAKSYQPLMESLSRHTTAAAHIAQIIAGHSSVRTETAFMCGLLHDVGIAGILIALSEQAGRSSPPLLATVWPAIDAIHEDVSRIMADRWGLPASISGAIGAHHRVVSDDGSPDLMAAVLRLTEFLTNHLGFPIVESRQRDAALQTTETIDVTQAMGLLGLTSAEFAIVEEAARTRLGECRI